MDCPTCHSLNPADALSCSMCGAVLIRREAPSLQHACDAPVGLSYSATAPNTSMLNLHARRAVRFLIMAFPLHVLLAATLIYGRSLATHLGLEETVAAMEAQAVMLLTAIFGMLVVGWSIAKMGEATGMGFWTNLALAIFPPTLPAAMTRIGGRSILWTYVYLAVDALLVTMAIQFFDLAPTLAAIVLIVETPLIAYHLTGCSTHTIAAALGLNGYLVTIWVCAGPLALMIYEIVNLGIGSAMVEAMVGDGPPISAATLAMLLDPTLITGDYGVASVVGAWVASGWIFWIKSVYESLRYPLF